MFEEILKKIRGGGEVVSDEKVSLAAHFGALINSMFANPLLTPLLREWMITSTVEEWLKHDHKKEALTINRDDITKRILEGGGDGATYDKFVEELVGSPSTELALAFIKKGITGIRISREQKDIIPGVTQESIKDVSISAAPPAPEAHELSDLLKKTFGKLDSSPLAPGALEEAPVPDPAEKKLEPKKIPVVLDEDIKEFNDLMKEIVDLNKGSKTRTLKGQEKITKLVAIIEAYKGHAAFLREIQKQLKGKTQEDKKVAVRDFIKTVI